jgi:hypothetical protein
MPDSWLETLEEDKVKRRSSAWFIKQNSQAIGVIRFGSLVFWSHVPVHKQ